MNKRKRQRKKKKLLLEACAGLQRQELMEKNDKKWRNKLIMIGCGIGAFGFYASWERWESNRWRFKEKDTKLIMEQLWKLIMKIN